MSILYSRLFSSLYFLLLLFFTSQLAKAEINSQNFHYFCDFNNRGNYTANSTYATNLNKLLSTLTSNTEITYGFYNFSQGQNTNKINAIGLCRGDINPNECRNCLTSSRATLTQLCPNQKEAIGWYEDELCMLRYSDRSIFEVMEIGPAYYAQNMSNASDLDEFEKVLRILLDYLKSKAAFGDSFTKYGAGNISRPNGQTIYGLVQCTPYLSVSNCSDCLSQSIARIQLDCCKDKIGGRVVRPSCNMRFETSFLFFKPTPTPPPPPPSTTTNNTSSQGKNNITIGIIVAVPIVVTMVLIFICICLRVRKQRRKFEAQEDEDDEIEISESLKFTFDAIRNSTNDFSDSNKLGQGGFGAVYHGRLSNGQAIAVKRLSRDSGQGDLEFKNEVLLVAKLQHRNLVRLLGFCLEGRERLLVYEFVVNKSLDYFIFDQTKRTQLNWKRRYKIIVGIARGILYLHEDSRLRIIHRDLKASNILLDEDMNPKIADFGMARLFGVDQTQENTNRVVGTYGYMAPEYAMHGEFSVKSDVFSFGVLVLETISGRKSSGVRRADNTREYLLSFVWRNWREGLAKIIIDQTLNSDSVNEIMRCIHIGLLCVQENAASRPTMASILLMLNSHSLPLSVPSEPAFHVDGGSKNLQEMMQSWDFSVLAQESINGASITEPYPPRFGAGYEILFIYPSMLVAFRRCLAYVKKLGAPRFMIWFYLPLLTLFGLFGHHPKAPSIIEVTYPKPLCGWVKCNSEGTSHGNPGPIAYGGLFCGSSGEIMDCFLGYVGIATSFEAEILAIMKSIEVAYEKGWCKLWIECNSALVPSYKSFNLVPLKTYK